MLTGKDFVPKRSLPPDRRTRGGSFARAAGSFVPRIAAKAFEKFGFHTAEILMQWPTIVGREIAGWTQPERIRWPRLPNGSDVAADGGKRPGGTLVLRVEPARALDIEYRAAEIIERINRYFGYRAVETVKLIQAPLLDTSGAKSADALRSAAKPATAPHAVVAAEAPVLPAALDDSGGLKSALAELWQSVSKAR